MWKTSETLSAPPPVASAANEPHRRRRMFRVGLVALVLCAVHPLSSYSQADGRRESWREPTTATKLLASDGAMDDWFGWAVTISGDTALIGARGDQDQGPSTGSAYAFVRGGGTWVEQAKLTPDDAQANALFGYSVALSEDTALIGAAGDGTPTGNFGAAYVFVREGDVWTQQAKLVPEAPGAYRFLGWSVALVGDTALVGAPWTDGSKGAVYVFERTGDVWTEKDKLVASDGQGGDTFGRSVSLWEDVAVVGADGDDDESTDSGAAYVFRRQGVVWNEEAKLKAADADLSDRFGNAVSIVEDTVAVGAYQDSEKEFQAGAAYVFTGDGGVWTEKAKLLGAASSGAEFGNSVSTSPGQVLVGAPWLGANAPISGTAYRFVEAGSSWIQEERIFAADGERWDQFGISVSQSDDTSLIGAHLDDDNGIDSGSAYIFAPSALQLSVEGTCPGSVTVTVSGAPPNSEVGVVAAANTNGFTKGRTLCRGTMLEIGEPFKLPPLWIGVGSTGQGSRNTTLEEDLCWMEALALDNCDTSGAVLVP